MTILITAATGTVGRSLVSDLAAAGARLRVLVRDPDRARELLPPEVEIATGGFSDPSSIAAAVSGVRQVFLASPNHPQQVDWECAVIDAARDAGVRRVVKLSAHGARRGSDVAFWDAHARIEDHLEGSGLDWAVLRPTTYATNLLASLDAVADGVLPAPAAGARVAFIDPADVAAVAAAVLLRSRWTRHVLTLTGPEVLTFAEAAAVLSDLLRRPVAFVPVPDDAARAVVMAAGAPEWFADNLVRVFGHLRAGVADLTTHTVLELTARPPRSLAQALALRLSPLPS